MQPGALQPACRQACAASAPLAAVIRRRLASDDSAVTSCWIMAGYSDWTAQCTRCLPRIVFASILVLQIIFIFSAGKRRRILPKKAAVEFLGSVEVALINQHHDCPPASGRQAEAKAHQRLPIAPSERIPFCVRMSLTISASTGEPEFVQRQKRASLSS